MEIYFEIDFDSGTRRYSRIPLRLPDAPCDPRILSFGGIQREIGLVPGDYRAASVSFTLSNIDGEFSRLRSTEPWRNRVVRGLAIDLDQGIGSQFTAFIGRIATWSINKEQCEISAVDWIQSRLLRPVSGVIDTETYPNLPDETPRALIPVVIGEITSPGGAVPAYLVDPDFSGAWRYVMAQGRVPEPDQVFAYGVLVDPGDYTINYDDGPGGIECTYIDFDADPRTSDTANPHVSWNGSGITDDQTESGSVISNGAEQLALFLRLKGFAPNDLDLNTITEAAAELTSSGVTGAFAAVDQDLTIGDVVRQFAESYNLQVFTTQTGLVGMAAPVILVGESEDVPEVTALEDVVRGSFATGGREEVASSLVAAYGKNFFTGEFTATKTVTNSRQVTALGEDVVLRQEFPFIRDANAMDAAAAVKMFFLREARQAVQAIVPPHWYSQVDIGSTIRLTHFAAVGDETQIEAEDHQTADLVALWRMDEGEGQELLDTSGESNDGELGSTSGADADDPAWIAEGLSFDGVDDIATAPFLFDPDASDFTAFVVFRASAAAYRRVILYQQDGGGTGRVWLEISAAGVLATHIGGNVNAHSVELEPSRWYAATLRKLGTSISLFLEGGDKEDFTETAEACDGDMLIGWDEEPEVPAVPDIFQGIFTDDLLAWYRFDEGAGDTLTDYAGSKDGQLGSSAGADANDPDWVHEGLDFPTTGDRVVCPTMLSPAATDFTVFCAFRPDSTVAQRVICAQTVTWMYLETTNNRLSSVIGGTPSTNTTNLTAGTWYVGCVRKVGTTISIFVNGANKQDFTRTGGASTAAFVIGSFPNGTLPFHDQIALLAVYDNDLTDQQVADNSAAMAEIVADRIAEEPIPPAVPAIPAPYFDDRMALIAVYDDAMSDSAIAANTVSLKRIVNAKVAARGFYRVLGSGLISVGPSLAVALRAADLTQEQIIDLFVPPVPESLALSDGSSSVAAHLSGTFVLAGSAAGSSLVTANLSQRIVTPNLQHLWLFNQGSGQQLTDFVGSAHGQLGSGAGSDTNDPSWDGEGLVFDGVDNYVILPNFQTSVAAFTFMIAFKSDAPMATIVSQAGLTNHQDWLAHTSPGALGSGLGGVLNDGAITTGVWYLAYVRFTPTSGTTGTLRLNLRRTGSNSTISATRTLPGISNGVHVLGFSGFEFPSSEFGFPFNGKMGLMAHYNRALSDEEMTQMFEYAKAYLAARGISL